MARRSSIDALPEAVRHSLERKLSENGFANYTALADWLTAQGYEIAVPPCTAMGKRWNGVLPASKPAPKRRG